ncbi:MAG: LamG domain-containing protein, partial [Phycisphaerales bacterium]
MLLSGYSTKAKEGKLCWGFVLLLLLSPAVGVGQSSLVLHLPMEDAINPVDVSANPATVTVNGALALADGQFGKGLEFDGNAANRLEVTSAPKLEGMSALTIEAWVLGRNISSYEGMSIASKRNAYGDSDNFNLFIWTNQLVNGRVNGNNSSIGLSTTAIQDDTWYHIAFTFDGQGPAGEKVKLYINGVLESSADHPDGAVSTGGAPVWIGELDANRGFAWDGIMDELGIWSVALNADQINWLMSNPNKTEILNLASGPTPADGSIHEATWVNLAWTAGEKAVSHDVYLGESFDEVNDATVDSPAFQGNQGGTALIAGFAGFAYPDGLVP